MAVTMTFNSLQADLQSYLERGTSVDTTVFAQLPSLINLAEREIARALKIQGFINVVTSAMVVGQSVYAKPDGWRQTISINFGVGTNRTPLFPRSYEYARAYWPDESQTDQPKFYADYDYSNWLFLPTPAVAYQFEVVYYRLLPLLDAGNQSNWLTEYAPSTLLYGALLQATPFLKNDERVELWKSFYNQALGDLNAEDLQKIVDRTSTRQES